MINDRVLARLRPGTGLDTVFLEVSNHIAQVRVHFIKLGSGGCLNVHRSHTVLLVAKDLV